MPNLNGNEDNKNEQNDGGFHPEVEERLKWWAEKHNKSLDDATGEFYATKQNSLTTQQLKKMTS